MGALGASGLSLDGAPQERRERIPELALILNFTLRGRQCQESEKTSHRLGRNICKDAPGKGIHRDYVKVSSKDTNNPVKNEQKSWTHRWERPTSGTLRALGARKRGERTQDVTHGWWTPRCSCPGRRSGSKPITSLNATQKSHARTFTPQSWKRMSTQKPAHGR